MGTKIRLLASFGMADSNVQTVWGDRPAHGSANAAMSITDLFNCVRDDHKPWPTEWSYSTKLRAWTYRDVCRHCGETLGYGTQAQT